MGQAALIDTDTTTNSNFYIMAAIVIAEALLSTHLSYVHCYRCECTNCQALFTAANS